MRLQVNQTDSLPIRNFDLARLRFRALVNDTNVAPAQAVDFEKLVVDIQLKRSNRTFRLNGQDFAAIMQAQNFFSSLYSSATGKTSTITLDAANKQFIADYPFMPILNVRQTEEVIVKVTVHKGFFIGATLNENASYLEVSAESGIGLEFGTPYLHTENIPQSVGRHPLALGDNVTSIILIDKENPTNFDYAKCDIQSVNLNSDKVNAVYDLATLVANRRSLFEDAAVANSRGNHLPIYLGDVDLDKVNIELSFNSAQVRNNRYVVVYGSLYEDARLVGLAKGRSAKHAKYNMSKIKR